MQFLGKTDTVTTDSENICTNFAKTFTEDVDRIKHNCDITFLNLYDYVKPCDISLRYQTASSSEIELIINQLSIKKSSGYR